MKTPSINKHRKLITWAKFEKAIQISIWFDVVVTLRRLIAQSMVVQMAAPATVKLKNMRFVYEASEKFIISTFQGRNSSGGEKSSDLKSKMSIFAFPFLIMHVCHVKME